MDLKVLLVEDETHKIDDLTKRIALSQFRACELTIAKSVKDAVLAVFMHDFELVILDMALPTFAKEKHEGESGGVAQASGGVEVIRAMQQANRAGNIIVVTQYPDIAISGERIKLPRIRQHLKKRYGQNVVGVVLYSYNDSAWIQSFDQTLESMP